jgi:RHS repeat-associated protein
MWYPTKRLTTSENGYPTWSSTFLSFGQEWNPQITVNHYKFTGKERDSESGLDNFGARYDSSQYGRFMTLDPGGLFYADPTNPQSLNLYSYVWNNPASNVDPSGLFKLCPPGSGSNRLNSDRTTTCGSRSNRRSHRRTRWAFGASCLQSKASTTLSLACAPMAPNSSARWPSTRTSTDSATCEALRASSSRWPRNSSEAFTAFGETGGALGTPSTRSHGRV